MPKAPRQLDPDDPVQELALEMRNLRLHAENPSLEKLGRAMSCSHATVSAYLNGRRLPPPGQLKAFVEACGESAAWPAWQRRLEAVHERLSRLPASDVPKTAAEQRVDAGDKHQPGAIADDTAQVPKPAARKRFARAVRGAATTQARVPTFQPAVDDIRPVDDVLRWLGYKELSPGVEEPDGEPERTQPLVEIHVASRTVAEKLQLGANATVVSRHQQSRIDGAPRSLQTSFYPSSLVTRGAHRLIETSEISQGAVAYLEEALGIKQVGYRDLITVRAPDENEAAFFNLGAGSSAGVFEVFRIVFNEDGRPIRLTISVFPGDELVYVRRFRSPNADGSARLPGD
jgi:transcriptional regulator with XRE-family HTH domain